MNQITLTDIEYSNQKKKTGREEFPDAMEKIIPRSYWADMIRPYHFNNKRGRRPAGIETMLRMYLMQIWFNPSDEGIEDSICDNCAMRSFMHMDFNERQVPDATTLLKFRHMLEKNKTGGKIFADVNQRLEEAGLMMHGGTIVDASLIAAPKSTKNREGKRGSGYIHTITVTSANMHDVTETSKLLREDDHVMYGDSGYLGAPGRPGIREDEVLSKIEFRISQRPSRLKTADHFKGLNRDRKMERDKSSVRRKTEHAFLIVKNQMGYAKTAYRGIEKNMNRFSVLFAGANLLMCSRAGRTQDFVRGMA